MKGCVRLYALMLLLIIPGCKNSEESGTVDTGDKNIPDVRISPQELVAFHQKNPLLLAQKYIEEGDFEKLKNMVKQIPNINGRAAMGRGLIHLAVLRSDKQITQYLIACGADPNARDVFQRTPLHLAASAGNREISDLLIQAGADVTSQTKDHLSIIHAATIGGLTQLVKLCLKKGVDINLQFRGSFPPLYYAIVHERSRLISMLRTAGADICASKTIAQAAAQKGDTILLKQILSRKGKEITSSSKNNLLHTAAQGGRLRTVKLLLKFGADINSKDPHHPGEGLLHSAVRSGNVRLVEFLFQKGIPVNHDDQMGKKDLMISPFHLALRLSKSKIAKLFRLKGYKIQYNSTAMSHAILGGLENMVNECLAQGVSMTDVIEANPSLPYQVARTGHQHMMAILLNNGIHVDCRDWQGKTPLYYAADQQDQQMIDFLLANGANINARDKKGDTPLHTSITYKHLETIRFLLKRGAKPGIANKRLQTPAFVAVRASLKEIAMQLLAGGYNLAAPSSAGNNLLHAAVMGVWPELIEFLVITKKMDINRANKRGITPLHLAARRGDEQLIRLLLKLGANPTATDRNNKTPADYLKKNTSPSLKTLLSKEGSNSPSLQHYAHLLPYYK